MEHGGQLQYVQRNVVSLLYWFDSDEGSEALEDRVDVEETAILPNILSSISPLRSPPLMNPNLFASSRYLSTHASVSPDMS